MRNYCRTIIIYVLIIAIVCFILARREEKFAFITRNRDLERIQNEPIRLSVVKIETVLLIPQSNVNYRESVISMINRSSIIGSDLLVYFLEIYEREKLLADYRADYLAN